jgi:inner membrane protein involved in colicin E2 resistance
VEQFQFLDRAVVHLVLLILVPKLVLMEIMVDRAAVARQKVDIQQSVEAEILARIHLLKDLLVAETLEM